MSKGSSRFLFCDILYLGEYIICEEIIIGYYSAYRCDGFVCAGMKNINFKEITFIVGGLK